ncbi:UNVERIFIED_CONTAM: hypothetical protein PYX00_011901 [Menopon gallinae]|uniref:Flavodoxin-like domain-containing protein n=1 Tax=Menopon gallinae TaxID=328185 RepID=A0AAW2H8M6_9NEOP
MNDKAVRVKSGIYRFGTNVEEKETMDARVMDEQNGKNALIDLVCEWEGQRIHIEDEFKQGGFSIEDIDYIVLNHMEPDHSGLSPEEKEKIFIEVKDGDMLDLKDGSIIPAGTAPADDHGRLLVFVFIPNVHWPETMASYDVQEKVLFPCDAFGSYGRIEKDHYFADQVGPEGIAYYKREALRYFANIVASFCTPVIQAITKAAKVLNLEADVLAGTATKPHFSALEVIAPSHGLMWRNNETAYGNPVEIINYYLELASYNKGPAREKICVVWASMYGNTQRILPFILDGIDSQGVEYEVFHLPYDHVGFAMSSAFECQGLVLGMPTYEYALHPPMAHFLDLLRRKHIKGKDALRFGSFGWSGGAQKELISLTTERKRDPQTGEMKETSTFNFIEPLEWRGKADKKVEQLAFDKGAELARLVKQNARKA